MYSTESLQKNALECRRILTKMIYEAGTGHIGGSLSSTDILVSLYFGVMNTDAKNPKWDERDRFILSKGHSVEAYYSVLAMKGFFPVEELSTFSKFGSKFIGHPSSKVPGVEISTGALGHGLPVAIGMALAAKMDKSAHKVYVLMGDGEQAEGSVWEGAMSAGNYGLDNLVAIIDRNRLQISGNTENVMKLDSLADKWRAFGWHVEEVDGHDMAVLVQTFKSFPAEAGKPHLVIANTIKGKGIPFMENVAKWHHGVLDDEQYRIAMEALDAQSREAALL